MVIKCPECGSTVSDKAKHCLNCGFPINKELQKNDNVYPKIDATRIKDFLHSNRKLIIIIGIAIIIIALIASICSIRSKCSLRYCDNTKVTNSRYCSKHTCSYPNCYILKGAEDAFCSIHESDSTSNTPISNATVGEKNALDKAKSYLRFTAFSYEGLIEQLEYEGYTHSEAVYGADNCGADWNEQAAKKAESYLEHSSFSRSGLIDQLEYEGFTYSQAVYGVEQNGY